jgi:hypothetical protein
MSLGKQVPAAYHPTGIRALWGYIKESTVTEFWSMLRALVAPLQALRTGSLDPIRTAFRRSLEDSDRVIARYLQPRQ